MIDKYHFHIGDALTILKTMADQSVNCWVTSPPYWWLRDYGVEGQLGLEKTPEEYIAKLVEMFREARRVLRDDGTLWLNLGDSYAANGISGLHIKGNTSKLVGSANSAHYSGKKVIPTGMKEKDLVGIPWMVAFALRADGWYLRQDIIWNKPNPMPESVKDRCTKAHEYIFLLSKSDRYYYDQDAIKEPCSYSDEAKYEKPYNGLCSSESHTGSGKTTRKFSKAYSFKRKTATTPPPGQITQHREDRDLVDYSIKRNKRSVWTVPTYPFPQAHFATFPPALIEPCILAGCPEGGIVGDMFAGSATTGEVALKLFRRFVGIELSPTYANEIAIPRLKSEVRRYKQQDIFD